MPSGTTATLDDQAFAAILQKAMPSLRTFVHRLCGHEQDTDDVLQEALTKAWRLRRSFDPLLDRNHKGSAWLQRTAFRVFCDHRARCRRQPVPTDDLQEEPVPDSPCRTELRDELEHKLSTLPDTERSVLLGFHRDGLSLRELARQQDLSINTVKSHLHRARGRLQQAQRQTKDLEGKQ